MALLEYPCTERTTHRNVVLVIRIVNTKAFSRQYTYDKMGNMLSLQHTAASPFTSFTRTYTVPPTNNKMNTWGDGTNNYNITYDSCGNMLSDNLDRNYEWDWANNMRVFRNQVPNDRANLNEVEISA